MYKPRYRLLKNLPVGEAGDIVFEHDGEVCFEKLGILCSTGLRASMLCENSWFEEIQEPTDSIHWKPEVDDSFWVVHSDGDIIRRYWDDCSTDLAHYEMGRIYRTEKEAKKARDRELAEVRLRRTSTFKPDFKNNHSGYVVYYDFRDNKLDVCSTACCSYGECVHYKTKEEAENSIKENKKDWLIYFGVDED